MNKACEKLHSILDIENSYVKQVYSLFLNNNLFLSDRTSSMDYGQSFGILIRSKSGTLSAQDWKRSHFDSILPIRLLNGSDISSAYLPEDTNLLLCVVKTDQRDPQGVRRCGVHDRRGRADGDAHRSGHAEIVHPAPDGRRKRASVQQPRPRRPGRNLPDHSGDRQRPSICTPS